jgi:hypothetical protein
VITPSLNRSTAIVNQKTLDTSQAPTPGLPFCQGGGEPPTPQANAVSAALGALATAATSVSLRTRSRPKPAHQWWEKGTVAVRLPRRIPCGWGQAAAANEGAQRPPVPMHSRGRRARSPPARDMSQEKKEY